MAETHWRLFGAKLALERDLGGAATEAPPVAVKTSSKNVQVSVAN